MLVGERIKKYLDEKGITQASLARKTGISASKLNLSLNGKRTLDVDELELICGVLEVSPNAFVIPVKPNSTVK